MGKPFNVKSRIRGALRKIWLWSPNRRDALANARVRHGHYKCAHCGHIFGARFVAVDHIVRVTPYDENWTWDSMIERLFCGVDGLQVLCDQCHQLKTEKEREEKKQWKIGLKLATCKINEAMSGSGGEKAE